MFAFAFVLSAERSHNYHSEYGYGCEYTLTLTLTRTDTHTPAWTQLYATDSVGSSITTIAHWTIGVHCTARGCDWHWRNKEGGKETVQGGGLWACWTCNCGASRCRCSTDNIWQTQMQTRIKNAQRDINDSQCRLPGAGCRVPGAMPHGRWLTSWVQAERECERGNCSSCPLLLLLLLLRSSFSAIHLARQTFALAILGQYRQISMQI